MDSRIWTRVRYMIEESFCGVWENGTVFFYSSFEFIERKDNSKGYCSVSVSMGSSLCCSGKCSSSLSFTS